MSQGFRCHFGTRPNTKGFHKIGFQGRNIQTGNLPFAFSTLNVQICLFWVSTLNFDEFRGCILNNCPGKHVVFGCPFLHQLQIEPKRKPASCHSLCEKQCCLVPYFFFWGGRVCLFRYTVTLYIYLDPIHCSHLHHPFCFCFFFEVQEILSRKNCYWRSREFLSSEI